MNTAAEEGLNKEANIPPLTFNNIALDEVSNYKHLGIILNDKLKWTDHINHISDSVKKITDVFRILKYKLDRQTLETIYMNFVRPKLEYGSILFDDCSEYDKNRLEKIELTFGRIVCGAKRGTSHESIYNEILWPKLEERRKENKLKFIYNIVNHTVPPYLKDILPNPPCNNPHNLRNNEKQRQFKFHTTKFQRSILPDSITLWNKLTLV